MVTIATFSKPEEAHLFRMRLEAGGVQAFVQDEHLVQMNWIYSNAIGGVRVQIFEEDIPLAKDILQKAAVELPDSILLTCPFCGSTKTKQDELPRRIAFFSLLLFSFPFLFSKRRYECEDCGKKWNERQKSRK